MLKAWNIFGISNTVAMPDKNGKPVSSRIWIGDVISEFVQLTEQQATARVMELNRMHKCMDFRAVPL